MGTIIKLSIRNIFVKPLITIFLVLSIVVCSFAGLLAFDMSNSLSNILKNAFADSYGKANVLVETVNGVDRDAFDGLPEHEAVFIATNNSKLCVRNDNMYAFYNEKNLSTYGVNIEEAKDMNLIPKDTVLEDNECIITDKIAEDMNLKIGDSFTIYGDNYVGADFVIKDISSVKGILSNNYSALITDEGMKSLTYNGQVKYSTVYVHVLEDSNCETFCEKAEELYPAAYFENLVTGAIQDQIDQISGIFIILFIITLLLVIFVTITLSERIMIDRLSTVGTLRSLGISPSLTARVILVENMFYGLLGGAIGTVLYIFGRDPIFNNIFTVSTGSDAKVMMDLGTVSIPVTLGVILGAVIVEMLCPLRELLKATGRPIRDIIFDNRDTEYKYKKKYLYLSVIIGVIAAALGILGLFVLDSKVIACIAAFVLLVIAVFMGYPFIIKGVASIIEKAAMRSGKPILGLAATSMKTKKTSIGSSKLTFIATAISMSLLVIGLSFDKFSTEAPADADIVVDGIKTESGDFDYIKDLPGVTDVEFVYKKYGDEIVSGTENIDEYIDNKYEEGSDDLQVTVSVTGAEGRFDLYSGFPDLPEKIEDDEVYLTHKLAEELGVKVGDEHEFLMNSGGVVPFRKTYKIAGYADPGIMEIPNTAMVISLNEYKKIYLNSPDMAYVRAENPEEIKDKIESYSSSMIKDVKTMEEYQEYEKEQGSGMISLLYMTIAMGVGLSLIGVFCNQIVGFENRKRESAVLISTALSREKLIKMFFCENLIGGLLAVILGAAVGAVETLLISKALQVALALPISFEVIKLVIFLLVIFASFSITIFRTIKNIKKMKISEQLKYE